MWKIRLKMYWKMWNATALKECSQEACCWEAVGGTVKPFMIPAIYCTRDNYGIKNQWIWIGVLILLLPVQRECLNLTTIEWDIDNVSVVEDI